MAASGLEKRTYRTPNDWQRTVPRRAARCRGKHARCHCPEPHKKRRTTCFAAPAAKGRVLDAPKQTFWVRAAQRKRVLQTPPPPPLPGCSGPAAADSCKPQFVVGVGVRVTATAATRCIKLCARGKTLAASSVAAVGMRKESACCGLLCSGPQSGNASGGGSGANCYIATARRRPVLKSGSLLPP